MKPIRIFISSMQKEFAEERCADTTAAPLLHCIPFRRAATSDRRVDSVYLSEVECGQFIQILGRRLISTTPEVTGEVTGEVGTKLLFYISA